MYKGLYGREARYHNRLVVQSCTKPGSPKGEGRKKGMGVIVMTDGMIPSSEALPEGHTLGCSKSDRLRWKF